MKSLSAQFADWVGQQDPEAEYDYDDVCGCAFYRFLDAAGYPVECGGGGGEWWDLDGHKRGSDIFNDGELVRRPWTFGALSQRLAKQFPATPLPGSEGRNGAGRGDGAVSESTDMGVGCGFAILIFFLLIAVPVFTIAAAIKWVTS